MNNSENKRASSNLFCCKTLREKRNVRFVKLRFTVTKLVSVVLLEDRQVQVRQLQSEDEANGTNESATVVCVPNTCAASAR